MIPRYTLQEMGAIWDDKFKFDTWLRIEILACEARALNGDIPEKDLAEIKEKASFDVNKILGIEETTKHDVIAFLTNVAEHVGPASRHIHYGMTSSDILDTTLSYQMKSAGELIMEKLHQLKDVLKKRGNEHKYTLCIGRSHGIHAEPTTMGLKFALWYEEAKRNIKRLNNAIEVISVGQISGAVGTFEHLSPAV
jgi:adenylosuccinate lyase